VIAESPGQKESELLEPLVGGAGKVAQALYAKANLRLDDCTKLNVLQCRPLDNIFPDTSEARSYISKEDADKAIEHCLKTYVRPLVSLDQWSRVDLLGEKALRYVGGREGGINKWRGSIIDLPGLQDKPIAVPTIHPAAVMRDWSQGVTVVSDLKKTLVIPPENYTLYPGMSDLQNFTATEFCTDIETNRYTNEIFMVGLSDKAYHAIVVPFKGGYISELKRIFKNAKSVIGHNLLQFDAPILADNGIVTSPDCELHDTMLAHHLLSPDQEHSLAYVGSIFTNKGEWKSRVDEDKELYCARDVDVTMQVWPQLRALLKQQGLWNTYTRVSIPVAKICYLMTQKGIRVDTSQISKVREKIRLQQVQLELQLPEKLRTGTVAINRRIPAPPGTLGKSGKPVKYTTVPSSETVVPWRSDKSVGAWLYTDLKLPVQKHIKTGKVSTDKYSLERLARNGGDSKAAILAIKELRSLDETLTTFTAEKVSYGTTINPHFSVHGTNSGRLSSSGPNCQNIPQSLRCIYIPSKPDHYIVQMDFSSIENRLTAHLAHDTERLARFAQEGFNEHKFACSQFFGIPVEEVVKSSDPNSLYSKAKHVCHGMNYGLGARKMSQMYSVPEGEVKKLLSKWKSVIPKTANWQEYTASLAKVNGVLTNPFGRKRWFGTSNYYTESLSFLPQSTAADILLRCMIALCYEKVGWPIERVQEVAKVFYPLPKEIDLLVTVHDSLVFQVPKGMLNEIVEKVEPVLTQKWPELAGFSCPVEIEYGPSWGELEKYEHND